ncbi:unnamed protein product [Tuber melanosporum]|uniref:(Perigord truffle) hypothetical protein n=1 Tax=Tuber melanosporum (strain Mel28) TaxID=656061 RepID=D5GIN0_TUBMM|nr:uncharacterized protein GSTUM_00008576001 [Tuber melanosporum]CAZ84373.1 unnamed protein product [Tuber melanosporum]
MASPESNRIGGARPSGAAGVKGLLAMFENSGSAGPASGNASRDISPSPKPLSKVRTSFVAVTGSNGQMMGLQRISAPPSPVVTTDGGKFTPGFQDKDKVVQEKSIKKEEGTEPASGAPKAEEPKKLGTKADFTRDIKREIIVEPKESVNGFSTPKRSPTVPTSVPEKVQIKKDAETPQKPLETIPTEAGEEKKDTKPTKADTSKPRPAAIKTGHPPKSPMKSGFNSPRSNRASVKPPTSSGNTLTLPTSRTTTTSPLPSPTIPRSPARGALSTTGSANSRKPASTSRASSKTRSTTTTSISNTPTSSTFNTNTNDATLSTASKTRQPATSNARASAPPKTEQKPVQPREPTKPAAMRGSAFGPTAASAAKLAADQAKQPTARRPPSSTSTIRRTSPNNRPRRPESNLGTRPTARQTAKSPVRPATSAATRNSRTSAGSTAGAAPVGGDFLSRMMRPTTASASKVTDKKQIPTHQPPRRSGSVTSTSRRKEASSLPPPKVRLQKEDTQSEGSAIEESATQNPTRAEGQVRVEVEACAVTAHEAAAPEPNRITEAVEEPKSIANELSVDTTAKEITNTNTQGSSVAGTEEDEGHTPTTTASSSTTLVHEGDDQEEVTTKEE